MEIEWWVNSSLFDLKYVFNPYNIILKSIFIIFCFHCIIYFNFNFLSLEVISFVVWTILKPSREQSLVSELFLIQLIQCFWCVHHHTKNLTHNIMFVLFNLYLFSPSIRWSDKLHCLIYFCNNHGKQSDKWISFDYIETIV